MAKKGGTKHVKRIAAPKAVPVTDRKARHWMTMPSPGPHPKKHAIPLGVMLRDILKVAKTLREVRMMLARRLVEVDGRVRTDEKFPVGIMDVIAFPKGGKYYRVIVDWKGRLVPMEISKEEAASKIVKVVGKRTIPGGKLSVNFHDGRNMVADNHVKVGDSVVVSLPKAQLKAHLKSQKGARCLVFEGKHAGSIVKLKDIIVRKGSKPSEALVESDGTEFITVAKYLFVVDDSFRVKAG